VRAGSVQRLVGWLADVRRAPAAEGGGGHVMVWDCGWAAPTGEMPPSRGQARLSAGGQAGRQVEPSTPPPPAPGLLLSLRGTHSLASKNHWNSRHACSLATRLWKASQLGGQGGQSVRSPTDMSDRLELLPRMRAQCSVRNTCSKQERVAGGRGEAPRKGFSQQAGVVVARLPPGVPCWQRCLGSARREHADACVGLAGDPGSATSGGSVHAPHAGICLLPCSGRRTICPLAS